VVAILRLKIMLKLNGEEVASGREQNTMKDYLLHCAELLSRQRLEETC
jgi:hypothetical protein